MVAAEMTTFYLSPIECYQWLAGHFLKRVGLFIISGFIPENGNVELLRVGWCDLAAGGGGRLGHPTQAAAGMPKESAQIRE